MTTLRNSLMPKGAEIALAQIPYGDDGIDDPDLGLAKRSRILSLPTFTAVSSFQVGATIATMPLE